MKRVLGAAALGGGLLALSAGAAGAQEISADVRVCADGRVLSRLVGSCGGSGTTASVRAGRSDAATGVRVRARVPRTAEADVAIGTRRSRPAASASGQAATSRPRSIRADADISAATSPRPRADASASLTRRARPLLDLDATASLAGVGLLGSSPFTLVGDPATDNLLPTGELTLANLTGETPAGVGVVDSGPIASGNQVGVDVGDVSPSVPVTVCGNGVGVLGDASASCTPATPSGGSSGSGPTGASAGSGSASSDPLLGSLASGNQVDAGIGDISPSVPLTVCGNSVAALGDASASCGPSSSPGTSTSPGADTTADIDLSIGTFETSPDTGTGTGTMIDVGTGADPGVGIGVDLGIGTNTSTGGTTAPPPGTTSPGGTDGPGSSTGTSGVPGTQGLTPGSGGADGSVTTFAPLRPSVAGAGSGALPFTGAAGDLLALIALALLVAGALVVRATRPAAATEGGDDR